MCILVSNDDGRDYRIVEPDEEDEADAAAQLLATYGAQLAAMGLSGAVLRNAIADRF